MYVSLASRSLASSRWTLTTPWGAGEDGRRYTFIQQKYVMILKNARDCSTEGARIEMLKRVLHTRGSGNLIWSTLTWSMRGMHMRFGNTMSEAMMSRMVSSDSELGGDMRGERAFYNQITEKQQMGHEGTS